MVGLRNGILKEGSLPIITCQSGTAIKVNEIFYQRAELHGWRGFT